jgi:sugar phosphate isomerase/epimerase
MLSRMQAVLEEVFARVGHVIALAHAKDVRLPEPGRDECVRPAAGTGVLDYTSYIRLLRESGYDGALVMHSLTEAELPASKAYVESFLVG